MNVLTQSPFFGLGPLYKNWKIHFERRICIRLQVKTHLTWWTPKTENRSSYSVDQVRCVFTWRWGRTLRIFNFFDDGQGQKKKWLSV